MRLGKFVGSLVVLSLAAVAAAGEGFSLMDTPGDHIDVLYNGKIVGRYMYAYNKTGKRDETYKTFLHVFDADGKAPITKGAGGYLTHHRGIFVGWASITYNGEKYDRWH